ncbi:3-phosphoserine/phosphohydroxythreonine transaminase [Wenzhouxiangella sp. XN24]|uniref:3-phosphoserine/phosphohydroxythreonine transaminase n=1 Tax=Wenzhouxiangella sp. XN24 TaxID=2713569 RepID=UPI0013EBA20E|nr:3-phosphoserine/phosphohydroxythreonine transaminase [Wenzhouxiangella sp. XN24]NGX16450.1 3-phosphoserine/phosphohydroxythreonine transaminase [Wenzhouxiangella sp. XN24]
MERVFNFSAGPAAIPLAVLERARDELVDWQGCGMSVMELSHRGKEFMSIAERAEADLRRLLDIPAGYRVLFLQGGASAQFSAVPLNLAGPDDKADYVVTGSWSKKALAEGRRFLNANVAADSAGTGHTEIPDPAGWATSNDAAYLHYTPNETIGGVEFHFIPEVSAPLVADMSSTLLSRPLDVSRFGLIYAGAQKNIGPAGLAIAIVREDLMGRARSTTPVTMDYHQQSEAGSMYNTPPTWAWYIAGLVFQWLLEEGGLEEMERRNRRKAETLYGAIDGSDFYANPVAKPSRSWMNIPFTLADPSLDGKFLEQAKAAGLLNLKGHRSVGGMRASIYNAMPQAGVEALVAFMTEFERTHG